MSYKIFIISIERNEKRYTSLIKKLKEEGFDENNIEVFIGVDYKKTPLNYLNRILSPWGRFTPKSVIACASSHILLWNYISKQKDIDFALILEDDSYVKKNLFDSYLNDFKKVVTDDVFLNLSTSARIANSSYDPKQLFVESHVILAMDTYILTPNLCKKLFDFYRENGLSYHIDLHLTFIKKYIPMKLIHFNYDITEGNLRLESSMVSNHKKRFILNWIKETEAYKELNTPIIEYENIVFNAYNIILILFFFILITITFKLITDIDNISPLEFIFLSILWSIYGLCVFDAL